MTAMMGILIAANQMTLLSNGGSTCTTACGACQTVCRICCHRERNLTSAVCNHSLP